MEDFYKKLGDKLEKAPTEATDWSMWNDIEKHLEKGEKRRIVPFWIWLLGMMAIGTAGYFIGANTYNSPNSSVEVFNDTIYVNRTITKIDTIFKNVSEEAYQKANYLKSENYRFKNELAALQQTNALVVAQLKDYKQQLTEQSRRLKARSDGLTNFETYEGNRSFPEMDLVNDKTLYQREFLSSIANLDGIELNSELYFESKKPIIIVGMWPSQIKLKRHPSSLLHQLSPDYLLIQKNTTEVVKPGGRESLV